MRACSIDDCDGRAHARGLCSTHYQRLQRYGSTERPARGPAICLAADCDSPNYSFGLCTAHYQRLRRHGFLEYPSVADRLLALREVDPISGCWLWKNAPDAAGYGRISIGNDCQYAHRVSYETFIGPIPDGLSIDHLCRVQRCINPAHLEPVTLAENTRRENAVRSYR